METPENLAKRLGNVSHFMNLPLADRLSVVLAGHMRLFSPNTIIFSEGEPCAGMFVLLKGHVHICRLGPQGQQNIIADIEPVIMFNEVALLDGGPNPYTAIATQGSFAWHISPEAYQKLLKQYAKDKFMSVALGLLSIMSHRYRQLLDNYTDLSFLTVPIRVAKLIYELSDHGNLPINRREISINEMAARIATVPEAISRSLNFLRCKGIIHTTRTKITVLKPDELVSMANAGSKDIFIYGQKR
ncbi:Crp/Fnr family transcriptional regulator [Chloroflexi bacterium CFX2]|nr:Crp/Fnr family transcriptional regulator [Chloroflexi bacterium CFX2]